MQIVRPCRRRQANPLGNHKRDPHSQKGIIIIEAFSTHSNRIKTLILLVVSGITTVTSVVVGIDDNPSGTFLAFLSAITFVVVFSHPWRTARKFAFLLLASVLGFALFIILSIISDSIVQDPTASIAVKNLIQSPFMEVLSIIIIMICPAAFIVGVVGSVAMFIRNRRQTT